MQQPFVLSQNFHSVERFSSTGKETTIKDVSDGFGLHLLHTTIPREKKPSMAKAQGKGEEPKTQKGQCQPHSLKIKPSAHPTCQDPRTSSWKTLFLFSNFHEVLNLSNLTTLTFLCFKNPKLVQMQRTGCCVHSFLRFYFSICLLFPASHEVSHLNNKHQHKKMKIMQNKKCTDPSKTFNYENVSYIQGGRLSLALLCFGPCFPCASSFFLRVKICIFSGIVVRRKWAQNRHFNFSILGRFDERCPLVICDKTEGFCTFHIDARH